MKKNYAFLFTLLLCCLVFFAACDETPNTPSTETNPSTTEQGTPTTPSSPTTPHTPSDGCSDTPVSTSDSKGLAYVVNEDDTTCSITGIGTCTDSEVIVPSMIDGYRVSSISGFLDCTNLTSIVIPDGVTVIGGLAFSCCTSLANITIPDSVTVIGEDAFYNCSKLIQLENGVSYVDRWIIDCDTSITSVSLRVNTIGIGNCAFMYCTSLTSITIHDAVTSIGNYAFKDCKGLSSITIPDSVTSIGDSAFESCTSLTNISIPNSVTNIGVNAFSNCESLENVYITDIEAWCKISFAKSDSNPLFNTAKNLYLNNVLVSELTIPDSVTSIGAYTFYGCTSLTRIVIPNNVINIDYVAFGRCTNLKNVFYGGTASKWNTISIDSSNSALTSATRYYYSETEPTESGNYWHYVDGVPMAW